MGALVRSGKQAVAEAKAVVREQFLTFTVVGETFGMSIGSIREIINYDNVTPVPMMPAFIRGVINLRGSVVPLVDLAVRFGNSSNEVTKRTCIVVLDVEDEGQLHLIGIVVDAVNAVLEIGEEDIESAPSFGAKIRADFITGMGKIAGKFVILLDIAHVLSIDELSLLNRAAEIDVSHNTRDQGNLLAQR